MNKSMNPHITFSEKNKILLFNSKIIKYLILKQVTNCKKKPKKHENIIFTPLNISASIMITAKKRAQKCMKDTEGHM